MFKKIMAILLLIVMLTMQVFAFDFPEPDWGALLSHKTDIVKTPRLGLYSEGAVGSVPYFGARLEPKNGVYFGMVTEYSEVLSKKPSSYLTYFDFNSFQEDIYYPANDIIKGSNAVVTIGWTLSDIKNIASKESYIRKTINTLASYNKPMFIRFANEMNVSPIGDEPQEYIDAFRFVANIVHEYSNFAMVWSPNDLGALDRPFSYYYPGDEYVDWVGVSSYMKKYFGGNPNTAEKDSIYFMTGDYAWATNAIVPIIEFMNEYGINKPVMLSECGVAGSNYLGEDTTAWAIPRLRNIYYNLIMEYPQIKLINYFNVYRAYEKEYYNLSSQETINVLRQAQESGAYIDETGKARFSYIKAENMGTVKGKMPLYVSAYSPNFDNPTVKYYADGFEVHSSNKAPHRYELDSAAFENGEHPLKISLLTDDGEVISKSYSFYVNDGELTLREAGADFSDISNKKVEKRIEISVNGKKIEFDVQPSVISDRTLVPIRKFLNAIGVLDGDILFNEADSSVDITKGGQKIYLKINDNLAKVDGVDTPLDVPATLLNGRTMVPLRFVSETFGFTVNYQDSKELLSINMVG